MSDPVRWLERVAGAVPAVRRHLLLLVLAGGFLSAPAPAPGTAATEPKNGVATHPPEPAELPKLPVTKSPVELFRELLEMTPPERQQSLANRPPDSRKRIMEKLREYEQLSPEERQLRLDATELRWFLTPLLKLTPASRTEPLASMPTRMRSLVMDHLAWWDRLPPEMQQELLENETTVRHINELATKPPPPPGDIQLEQFEPSLQRWQSITEAQRERMLRNFKQCFELTQAERQKTLRSLSEAERRKIEKTLEAYSTLTPEQRTQCLRQFERLANLSPAERREFFRNAARWKLMTPSERQAWKVLVQDLSRMPPAPPGFGLPPLPSSAAPKTSPRLPVAATNMP